VTNDDLFGDWTPRNEGEELRNEGIDRVLDHNAKWLAEARAEAERWVLSRAGAFTGEDIRYHCQDIIGKPKHPNAWGGLCNSPVRHRIMQATGQYVQPRDSSSHARRIQVYVRCLP
jgi:hypothetical protein